MKRPLQIAFLDMEPSDAVEAKIRERVAALERFSAQIMSCRVTVEMQAHHHRQGNLFRVSVDVKVPGRELVISRRHDLHHAHEDVYVAIRDAFDATRRQLEDFVRRQRGDVKSHALTARRARRARAVIQHPS